VADARHERRGMSVLASGHPEPRGGVRQAFDDGLVVTWRNLKRVPRIPELAIFAIIQSVVFVLLFAIVFGGAIPLPGYPGTNAYREYLMPGIFAQTVTFASATTAIGFVDDMKKGIIDRFRSLPMARSAVLSGRAASDVVYNAGILVVLMVTGLAVGWAVNGSVADFLLGVALLLGWAFAMSWLGMLFGQMVPSVEVAQQVAFTLLFPIVFVSNVFVPIQTLPDWLQPVAEWNPVSTLTAATRELFGNPNPFATNNLPSQEPILITIGWLIVIVGVFAPLAVRKYRSTSS
jgi:ABC transporter DrrB family efflux protein